MRAIIVPETANAAADLRLERVSRPEAAQGQVLIKTAFAGVNRPDILQRLGLYKPPVDASLFLGLEVSGLIETQAGPWAAGQAVCALTHGGGYAEYVAVDAGHVMPIPKGWSMAEAATLPEVGLTVFANLVEHGGLKLGETVLIHGANSGIGAMTIQMGKALGAKVIATARGVDKCAFATVLGADLVIDTTEGDFVEAVKAFGGADIVLDIVGGDWAAKHLECLKFKGRLVQVGFGKSPFVELNLRDVMAKQAIITGSMLRPRSNAEKARLVARFREIVFPLIEAGLIKPVVDKVFDLAEAGAAHAYLESGHQKGKVVLRV